MRRVRILTLGIAFIVAISGFALMGLSDPSSAASKPKLSKKSITMTVQTTKTIKAKNVNKKKVKWTSGNKKIVVIKKTKGKYRQTVVLKAKKAGTCYVKAKIGKRVLQCKVTVKKKKTPAPVPPEPVIEAADKAAADFGVKLLQEINQYDTQKGNLLVSPESVLTAMAMMENGAAGDTLKELETVLGEGISADEFNQYLSFRSGRLGESKYITYSTANSIWAQQGRIQVKDSFIQKNKDYHKAEYREEAFDDQTVSKINSWVADKTRDMIKKIIDRLDANDRMVVINAIAFDGEWEDQFEDSQVDKKGKFTPEGAEVQTVNMLQEKLDNHNRPYIEVAGGTGFVKPYKGREIAFAGLLPPKGKTVDEYVQALSGEEFLTAWNKRGTDYNVSIRLPEFTYEYGLSLRNILITMGIKDAFDPGNADFSEMIEENPSAPPVYIDDVLHKTFIELNQRGTKAAAVTAVIVKDSAMPPSQIETKEVYLDRPFVYALVDMKTGVPLFIGIVRSITTPGSN